MTVGEVDISVAGQNSKIVFQQERIILKFSSLKSASVIAAQPVPDLSRLAKLIRWKQLSIKVDVAGGIKFELFPRPHWVVRMLNPQLRKVLKAFEM